MKTIEWLDGGATIGPNENDSDRPVLLTVNDSNSAVEVVLTREQARSLAAALEAQAKFPLRTRAA